MSGIPEENYAPVWAGDDRAQPALAGDERTILTASLDFQRRTFELKCSGVPAAALSERTVPPSGLRLHGLILVAMIAEYARHNGHADLLRERIDGATGP